MGKDKDDLSEALLCQERSWIVGVGRFKDGRPARI